MSPLITDKSPSHPKFGVAISHKLLIENRLISMQVVILDTNVLLDLFVLQELIKGKLKALATPLALEGFADVIARPLFSLNEVE